MKMKTLKLSMMALAAVIATGLVSCTKETYVDSPLLFLLNNQAVVDRKGDLKG